MPRVDHCNIFKGFCRLKSVLISLADMLCHGNVNDILRFCQLLGKKPFVILHLRRLRNARSALCNMHQQLIRPNLLVIQEPPFICADVVGTHRNVIFLQEGCRQITYAVCCHQHRAPLRLFENQDILFNIRLPDIFIQVYQLFGKNTQHSRLQQHTADRLGKISAESLFPVKKLVVAARVGGQSNHRDILT